MNNAIELISYNEAVRAGCGLLNYEVIGRERIDTREIHFQNRQSLPFRNPMVCHENRQIANNECRESRLRCGLFMASSALIDTFRNWQVPTYHTKSDKGNMNEKFFTTDLCDSK